MGNIRLGLRDGLDVSVYAKSEFDEFQMAQIRFGMNCGLDVGIYAKPEFSSEATEQVYIGLERGIDASVYAKPEEFYAQQMEEIRLGLEHNVDVSFYTDSKFRDEQMEQIRLRLEEGLDVSLYNKPRFNYCEMRLIRHNLECGVDITKYLDREYTPVQIIGILFICNIGLDASSLTGEYDKLQELGELASNIRKSIRKFDKESYVVILKHLVDKIENDLNSKNEDSNLDEKETKTNKMNIWVNGLDL